MSTSLPILICTLLVMPGWACPELPGTQFATVSAATILVDVGVSRGLVEAEEFQCAALHVRRSDPAARCRQRISHLRGFAEVRSGSLVVEFAPNFLMAIERRAVMRL